MAGEWANKSGSVEIPKWVVGIVSSLLVIATGILANLAINNSGGVHHNQGDIRELQSQYQQLSKLVDGNAARLTSPRYSADVARQDWNTHASQHRADGIQWRNDFRSLRVDLSNRIDALSRQIEAHRGQLAHRGASQRMDAIEGRLHDCKDECAAKSKSGSH